MPILNLVAAGIPSLYGAWSVVAVVFSSASDPPRVVASLGHLRPVTLAQREGRGNPSAQSQAMTVSPDCQKSDRRRT
ncbi:hypothetical protein CWR43_11815 [Rhizobium sullae]|uniref:Uncharacterized protein n=1 Tax=Rhizobium sullae TaxID=50338 RepID=A0A2N0DC14_RHISU|nr:hypothetical protein CWR43_11815 [Rhizobium sullae]